MGDGYRCAGALGATDGGQQPEQQQDAAGDEHDDQPIPPGVSRVSQRTKPSRLSGCASPAGLSPRYRRRSAPTRSHPSGCADGPRPARERSRLRRSWSRRMLSRPRVAVSSGDRSCRSSLCRMARHPRAWWRSLALGRCGLGGVVSLMALLLFLGSRDLWPRPQPGAPGTPGHFHCPARCARSCRCARPDDERVAVSAVCGPGVRRLHRHHLPPVVIGFGLLVTVLPKVCFAEVGFDAHGRPLGDGDVDAARALPEVESVASR